MHRSKSRQQEWQEWRVAHGFCRQCGQPRGRSKYRTRCTACGRAETEQRRLTRAQERKRGLL